MMIGQVSLFMCTLCVLSSTAVMAQKCPDKHQLDCEALPTGVYGDQYNCRKYWLCDEEVGGFHYTCEEDYLVDLQNKWSDFPDRVNCNGRPICDDCDENCHNQEPTATTTTTSNPGECSELCSSDWGDFDIECCSNIFCKCEAGVGYFINCQPGLIFVESIDSCDWEYNVECCGGQI